ncbi:CCDC25 protein, partial [Toxoplasma gondii MAS]
LQGSSAIENNCANERRKCARGDRRKRRRRSERRRRGSCDVTRRCRLWNRNSQIKATERLRVAERLKKTFS